MRSLLPKFKIGGKPIGTAVLTLTLVLKADYGFVGTLIFCRLLR